MNFIERVRNAGRINQILQVAVRFGFQEFVDHAGRARRGLFGRLRKADDTPSPELQRLSTGQRLTRMLEELGPTFVKIGQMLSTRQDILPRWAVDELRKLRDEVAPMPYTDIRVAIEEELGGPLEQFFSEFDPSPIAAASLGQVHRAVLRDGGAEVAVKVQRRGIYRVVERDLKVLEDLAETLDGRIQVLQHVRLPELLEEFSRSLRDELVYTIEGRNAERVAAVLEQLDNVRIPKVHWKLTTARLLVTEMFIGERLSQDGVPPEDQRSELATRIANLMLRQILVEGFFHADPHPGNFIWLSDSALGILDWGQVGVLGRSFRESLGEIFIALVTRDIEQLAEEICRLGLVEDQGHIESFRHDLGRALDRYFHLPRDEFFLGEVLSRILELSYEHKVQLPTELPILVKALVTTEGTCTELDPNFDLRAAFEPVVKRLIRAKMDPERLFHEVTSTVRQVDRIAGALPRQLTAILSRLENSNVRVRVETAELQQAAKQVGRHTNRLAAALMVTGCLIAGALLYPAQPTAGICVLVLGLLGLGFTALTVLRTGL